MILYRPVGTRELELIEAGGFTKFPPRLPEQPIFYPVLNERYAAEIASQWNVTYNDDHRGYVTRFEIDDAYAAQFAVHTVGAGYHQELWVPAEELDRFNGHITGYIQIVQSYGLDTEPQESDAEKNPAGNANKDAGRNADKDVNKDAGDPAAAQ